MLLHAQADPRRLPTRDITGLWPGISSGTVLLSRIGPLVGIRWQSVQWAASGVERASLPGFEPEGPAGDLGIVSSIADTPVPRRVTWIGGQLAVVRPVAGTAYSGGVWWIISAAWPLVEPGVPLTL